MKYAVVSPKECIHSNLCSFKVPVVANSITILLTLLKPLLPESFTSPIAAFPEGQKGSGLLFGRPLRALIPLPL